MSDIIFLLFFCSAPPAEIQISRDDVLLQNSTSVKPGIYRIPDANEDGVIRVRGNGLTIDFQGAELVGAPDTVKADEYRGFGLVAEGCKNLTIKNLTVRGFKVGMRFKDCDGLRLEGCDVSRNYRQHLKSTPQAEDLSDWLYGHENDKNEWLRYGAGIWIEDSKSIKVSRCRARNGQNGLCLVRVSDSKIYDNDMSFMSGWGLAMWRSSRNQVAHNKFDWCMRGFSHGVYHRGQDSAGIFVFEQCNDNVFAFNSATHGGDGFFLYAGNETLEKTGKGGCNRNLLYRNDFSHAAANGIEATFSEGNVFLENTLDECDHGIWGGYSYNTLIRGNTIRDCNNGISIEHGHDNAIEDNLFERNKTAIHLWQNAKDAFAGKPYGKNDTRSRGYRIEGNRFVENKAGLVAKDTADVWEEEAAAKVSRRVIAIPGELPGRLDAFLPQGALRGRKYIFIDEWGPYDFSSLRVFPQNQIAWGKAEFFVLGPSGEFRLIGVDRGVQTDPAGGALPGKVSVSAQDAPFKRFRFFVESGKEKIEVSGLLLRASWEVSFFEWKKDPREDAVSWKKLIAGEPLEKKSLDRLNFAWAGGKPGEKLPADHFGTVAETVMELPAGEYEVRTMSDDGVAVWIDGKEVLRNWTWHGPTEDKAKIKLGAGKHKIRVEHFEIDGYAQLQFWIEPR